MQFTLKLVVKLLILSQKTIEDPQSQSQASNFQLSHVRDERLKQAYETDANKFNIL